MAKSLKEGLCAADQDLVLDLQPFVGFGDCEVEDLLPPDVLVAQLDRWQRAAEVSFADVVKAGPIVPQIEQWAKSQGIDLKKPGWKVELAKRVKEQLLKDRVTKISSAFLDRWERVFQAFTDARGRDDS